MPKGGQYDFFKSLISKLAKKYNAPTFEPHITLLGDVIESDFIKNSEQLARQIKPFKVKIDTVSFSDQYFKCVFALAEKVPELVKANEAAREMFNRRGDTEFMPHMSLLYGKMDEEEKRKIASNIKVNETLDINSFFITDSSAYSKPSEWNIIKEVKFGQF